MGAILIFLAAVFGISGWWLFQQGLTSKPWLETGVSPEFETPNGKRLPKTKLGLSVFLGVVGGLFALFISGYVMRMEYSDWRNMPVPTILWVNTAILVVSSITLHLALISARKQDLKSVKVCLLSVGVTTIAFLVGQLMAWQQMSVTGYGLTANPANSFFYLLTGFHGLHILGGLIALTRVTLSAWSDHQSPERLTHRIDVCALYWHGLLAIWLVLFVVMMGWANELIDICSQLLS